VLLLMLLLLLLLLLWWCFRYLLLLLFIVNILIGGGVHIFKASLGVSENLRGPDIPEAGCIFFAAFPVGPRPES